MIDDTYTYMYMIVDIFYFLFDVAAQMQLRT
uniref:Uncharacterized protein n=1 Tax=virus sp. ctmTa7 TaxID=2828255 RepID=A0A8S5RB96_9VIRU|nr:MAG TPA: hypothetical protein [virus sp. ctmTa7]